MSRKCGEDYEGPDFVFKLQHTELDIWMSKSLCGVRARVRGGVRHLLGLG